MALQWTRELSVGVDLVDAQHRELFRRAERLLAGLTSGKPEDLGALLEFLKEYAVSHFGLEETWMRDTGYPGYLRHKAEHDRFVADVLALEREHERAGPSAFAALQVNSWLADWLKAHVSGTDAEMGRFIRRRTA